MCLFELKFPLYIHPGVGLLAHRLSLYQTSVIIAHMAWYYLISQFFTQCSPSVGRFKLVSLSPAVLKGLKTCLFEWLDKWINTWVMKFTPRWSSSPPLKKLVVDLEVKKEGKETHNRNLECFWNSTGCWPIASPQHPCAGRDIEEGTTEVCEWSTKRDLRKIKARGCTFPQGNDVQASVHKYFCHSYALLVSI